MTHPQRLERIWLSIEQWYAEHGAAELLHAGATEDAVASLQQALGLDLPDELRRSLQRHDGSREGGWPGGELLSCERIIAETQNWRRLLESGGFDGFEPDETDAAIEPVWWHHGWVWFDTDGGGNGAAIDLAPPPGGHAGQIIDIDHERGPSGPIAGGLIEHLEQIAGGLGQWQIVDDQFVDVDEKLPTYRLSRATATGYEAQAVPHHDEARLEALAAEGWAQDEEFEEHLGRARSLFSVGMLEEGSQRLAQAVARAVHPLHEDPAAGELLDAKVMELDTDAARRGPSEKCETDAGMVDAAGRLIGLKPDDDYVLVRCGVARYRLGDQAGLDLIAKAYRMVGEDAFEDEDPQWRELLVARGDITE